MMLSAIRLCKFHFSIAIAMMNPPMIKKINLCPKAAEVDAKSIPPDKGNKTMGSNAVTAMGNASVIHQIAIQSEVANTALYASFSPYGSNKKSVRKNRIGPK